MKLYMCDHCCKISWYASSIKEHIRIDHSDYRHKQYVTYNLKFITRSVNKIR